jgi:predicted nucleotidyltransferase
MKINFIKKKIREWARKEPLVKKVYIFGSRAREDYNEDSDLDIAIEINKLPYDTDVKTTWIQEKKRLVEGISILLPSLKLQLELLDNKQTPTILLGVRQSSILVYP